MTDLSMGIPPTSTTLVPAGTYDLRIHLGCQQGGKFQTVRVNLGYPVTVAELDKRMSANVHDGEAQVIRIEPVAPETETDVVTLTKEEYHFLKVMAMHGVDNYLPPVGDPQGYENRLNEITARHG